MSCHSRSIREITARHSSGISSIPRQEGTALFAHAWTMVDQIHVLSAAPRNEKRPDGPNQKKFYDTSEPATKMRNKMDHLNATIPNRAPQRGRQAPLFGTLSYFLVEPHKMKQTDAGTVVEAGTIVSITSGSVNVSNKATGRIPNPADKLIQPPVSQFILTAFDWNLEFEEVLEKPQLTLNKSSKQAEASLRKQAEAESRSGSAVVELMSEFSIADFVLMFEVVFGDQGVA